ncbi:MAG TPA: hypothetical protein VFZ27_12865 [Terriglobia bacterium]|nr:hypothetical protein [Terriglobia bacterium]
MATSAIADLLPPRARQAPGKSHVSRFSVVCLLLGTVAALYFQLFIFPSIPLLAQGDQSIYLLNGRRLLHGEAIYRDFFYFTFPGTDSTYCLLFKAFGVRAWIPNIMLILLGAGIIWLAVYISRNLMSGHTVFLPALLFLAFPYHAVLDGTHHWYSTLAIMAALAVALNNRTPGRLCIAGAFCGIATWYTQSVGPAVALALALFLVWEQQKKKGARRLILRNEAFLLISYFLTVTVLTAYFAAKAGLGRFLWSTLIFVLKYFSADWFSNWHVYLTHRPPTHGWPNLLEWAGWLFIHALLPPVYLLFFACQWRRKQTAAEPSRRDEQLMLVALVGLCSLLAVASAPSYRRLCTVSLPGIILLVSFLDSPGNWKRATRWAIWVISAVWIAVAPLLVQMHWRGFLDLSTGRTAFLEPKIYAEYDWIAKRAGPGDSLFGNQLICFSLGLTDPTPLDYVTASDYTRPEQVQTLVESLDRNQVRYILWYSGLPITHRRQPSGDNLDPLRTYLQAHYQLANSFPNGDRIFERRE